VPSALQCTLNRSPAMEMKTTPVATLNDPSLLRTDALIGGKWIAGTSRFGGVVAIVGDDPRAKSSTLPSSSAGVLADLHMPLLYPGDPGEALDLGRHAIALSRASGLWTALKIVADVADATASVDIDPDRVQPVMPLIDGRPYDVAPNGRLLTPRTLDVERDIVEVRYPLAMEYGEIIGNNDQATAGILRLRHQHAFQLIDVAYRTRDWLHSQKVSRDLQRLCITFPIGRQFRVEDNGDAPDVGCHILLQQFQPLSTHRGFHIAETGGVASRAGQADYEAAADRISDVCENDRNRACFLHQRCR